ncbi:SPOR domain-containing protein [Duganella sp. sic0402]|uniref:SPOR domain-containing protein n=1 Tax=Duganella sp. sic0402 TaxID=2854786 RepID=UPI001C496F96|nr:SPOR domain-containing protein [Duganella sp. sic0402]MBV7535733.1 SPOR domain-containing protein [Duganella sp. sic0402]
MGLFSKSGKNKQDAGQDSGYYTSADDQAMSERARSKRASSADGPKRRTRDREDDDPVLPEKKRARRRLVGAIMLALGVAVGLPMLLDSEPKPLSSDIEIKIPAKDKPLADAAPAPSSAATVAANAALDSREEIVEDVKPSAKPSPSPSPAAAAPVVAAIDTTKADLKAEAKAEADAKARADAKAEREQKARLEAEHKQEQERKLAEAKAEARLKAEKQEAERKLAEAKAKAAEKPAEAKPAAKNEDARALAILEGKPAAAPSAEKFVLQVAALSDQAKVDELRTRLKGAGISTFTQKTASGITRVRVGPFSSKEEAEKVKAKLSSIGLDGRLETV